MIRSLLLSAAALALVVVAPLAPLHADEAKPYWPADAEVYIISPRDGATVKSPVTVVFGLKGLGVAPAGVEKAKTGHHHLLIDQDPPKGEELSDPLPADAHVVHFGGGQTETAVELAPGRHTLQLIVGDASHVPHNPPLVSQKIAVTVEK